MKKKNSTYLTYCICERSPSYISVDGWMVWSSVHTTSYLSKMLSQWLQYVVAVPPKRNSIYSGICYICSLHLSAVEFFTCQSRPAPLTSVIGSIVEKPPKSSLILSVKLHLPCPFYFSCIIGDRVTAQQAIKVYKTSLVSELPSYKTNHNGNKAWWKWRAEQRRTAGFVSVCCSDAPTKAKGCVKTSIKKRRLENVWTQNIWSQFLLLFCKCYFLTPDCDWWWAVSSAFFNMRLIN